MIEMAKEEITKMEEGEEEEGEEEGEGGGGGRQGPLVRH